MFQSNEDHKKSGPEYCPYTPKFPRSGKKILSFTLRFGLQRFACVRRLFIQRSILKQVKVPTCYVDIAVEAFFFFLINQRIQKYRLKVDKDLGLIF